MSPESVRFDRAVSYYDQTRGFPPGEEKQVTAMIARVGGLTVSSRALEIGVGTGRIALPLSALVSDYYGIDISRPMLDKLRSKRTHEPVYVTEGDATQLPFPDKTFDGIIAVHVFHLIPGWQTVLQEIARVLRPGAALIHCWTRDNDPFLRSWDTWNEVIPTRNRRVGMHWQKNPNFLEEEGWQPQAEAQTHIFTRSGTVNQFLDHVSNRIWSALWDVTDDELSRGLEAIQPVLREEFPDWDAPVEGQSVVYARAYLPPQ